MIQCAVFEERSNVGCLRAAFDVMCANFMLLLRKTWVAALAFSVFMALLLQLSDTLFSIPIVVGLVLTAYYLGACCLHEVTEMGKGKLFVRALIVYILNSVIILLFEIIAVGVAWSVLKSPEKETMAEDTVNLLPYLLIVVIVLLVLFLALIPTYYSYMKFVVEPQENVLSVFGKSYKTGWKNFGYLFVVVLLTSLVALVAVGVLFIPTAVLLSAAKNNADGVALGDASALPNNFLLMSFIVCVVSSFLYSYVSMWALLTYYHAYGRIEARLKEKQTATQE